MALPGEEEDFVEALQQIDIPEALFSAQKALDSSPIFDGAIEDLHLRELVRETQAGAWWTIRDAPTYVRPILGTRPGT
eukprot:8906767-Pyramimonas_sp.AAC.1